jgi:hypothetical protein
MGCVYAAGNMTLEYQNGKAICIQDPSSLAFGTSQDSPTAAAPPAPAPVSAAAAGESGRPHLWWVGLVVGLGALALGLLLGVVFTILRRRQRQKEEQERDAPFELAAMQVEPQPLYSAKFLSCH